jgi:hypothetical protein
MFTPYAAKDAKAAADLYYLPLSQIFDYIRDNAGNGLYTVVVKGTTLTAQQIEVIKKYGYAVDVVVDEQDVVKYSISWN